MPISDSRTASLETRTALHLAATRINEAVRAADGSLLASHEPRTAINVTSIHVSKPLAAVHPGLLGLSDARFALGVVQVLEAADKSMAQGGVPVRVEC